MNDENFGGMSLAGIVRREDIDPHNVVTSERDCRTDGHRKTQAGHVRDSYKRGWLHQAYDRFAPF